MPTMLEDLAKIAPETPNQLYRRKICAQAWIELSQVLTGLAEVRDSMDFLEFETSLLVQSLDQSQGRLKEALDVLVGFFPLPDPIPNLPVTVKELADLPQEVVEAHLLSIWTNCFSLIPMLQSARKTLEPNFSRVVEPADIFATAQTCVHEAIYLLCEMIDDIWCREVSVGGARA